MHRITALVFTVIACISTRAQIYINGRKAVYDSQHNFMLATIPESALGNDYEATIRIDSEWRMVIINGKKITDKNHRGIEVVRMKDGTVRKVVVK